MFDSSFLRAIGSPIPMSKFDSWGSQDYGKCLNISWIDDILPIESVLLHKHHLYIYIYIYIYIYPLTSGYHD